MHYRELGRTGWKVSEVSFGAWAIGGAWGSVDDSESLAALNKAIDLGVNFIDTADVYGDGHSEQLIARVLKTRREEVIVATKAGRRLDPHVADGYNAANLTGFIERSLKNLDTDCLDLVQLALPAHRRLLPPGGLRRAGRSGQSRENSLLRRQRGKGRRGAQSHRVSRMSRPCRSSLTCSGTAHPSCFSAKRKRVRSGFSPGYRWRAGCSPAR